MLRSLHATHPALVALCAMGSACEPHADVDLVLYDQCRNPVAFQDTRSVRVSLLGEARFDPGGNLFACEQQSACFDLEAPSFEALRDGLRARGAVLSAKPGVGQGVVVTGFRDPGCLPLAPTAPLTFCGYQLAPLPDEDTELFVLLSCPDGIERVCWPHLFVEGCQ